jgi:parallel beta-helix repeat protein
MLIGATYPHFKDSDGSPLNAGYIYFGTVNLNPETNPISVYWDDAYTQPVSQPVRTLNGYIVRDGNIANVYAQTAYSTTVKNKNGILLYSLLDSTKFDINASIPSQLADTSDPTKGDALIGMKQPLTGAVARTVHDKVLESISVKDFGAKGDGVTDDTAAIQAAFTWLAAAQNPTISSWMTTVGHIHFPQGIYKISNVIKVRGFVVISGVGTGYVAGTTIRQYATDTHIFAFYGETASNRNLGTCVRDINFEFATNSGSKSGYALYYPKLSDIDGSTLSSNSHYIRNCRFGGWYRYGRFMFADSCNDIEISGNVIDVCLDGSPAIQLGTQTAVGGCSDVRISGNNFFDCDVGIWICNAKAVSINGNNFSNQQNITGRVAIKLATDTATENVGYISGISITGNSFWAQYTCLWISGSAIDVNYSSNVHQDCLNYPISGNGTTAFYRYKICNNTFHLANGFSAATSGTYPNTQAMLVFFGAKMYDSEICDNSIDANGLNAVISVFNDQSIDSWFGSGMTIRNNVIKNNTSYPGAYYCFVPTTAKELVIENLLTLNSYPTNLPVLNFSTNGFQIGDTVTFDCDYEVTCNRSGTNIGITTGRVRVSIARYASSGIAATKWNVTSISNIGDDYNGGGGAAIPAVTFSMQVSPNPYLLITATSTIGTPVVTTIKIKASNFRASGVAAVRCS